MVDKNTSQKSLEKVRDILFGEEEKTRKREFDQLEKRLMREIRALGSTLEKRIDGIEEWIQAEHEEFRALAEADKTRRTAGDKALSARITKLGEKNTETIRTLRQRLQATSKELKGTVAEHCAGVREELGAELDELRATLTSSADLAAVLKKAAAAFEREGPRG